MRMVKILALSLVVLAAVAAPALAAGETSNTVRGGLVYTWLNGTQNFSYFGQNVEFTSDPGWGGYLAYEYRFSKLMGVEVSTGYSSFDAGFNAPKNAKSTDIVFTQQKYSMTPIAFALNFHVFGRSYVDLYLGPVVGYYFMSRALDDAVGYGAQIGADWNVSDKGLAINTSISYIALSPDTNVNGINGGYNINPLSLQAGIAYRW